jgi:hypothetical protein
MLLVAGFPQRRPGFDLGFRTCGICGRQSGIEAGFLRILRFPLPIIPPPAAHILSIIQGCYDKPNGRRRTKWAESHCAPRSEKEETQMHTRVSRRTAELGRLRSRIL